MAVNYDTPVLSGGSLLDEQCAPAEGLSRREHEILVFERQWWKYAASKETAIKELFGLSTTRYYQLLNSLIDTPAALSFDPLLVKRLRRMRSSRQKYKAAKKLGINLDRL